MFKADVCRDARQYLIAGNQDILAGRKQGRMLGGVTERRDDAPVAFADANDIAFHDAEILLWHGRHTAFEGA